MKTKHFFSAALLAFFTIFFLSCDQVTTPSSEENNAMVQTVPEWCYTECVKGESEKRLEINYACDSCWTANFAANRYQFPEVEDDNGDMVPLEGVSVSILDLLEVLGKADSLRVDEHDQVDLFAMFAIEVIVSSGGDTTINPKLIFQVEGTPKEGSGSHAVAGGNKVNYYFDFTSPCPSFCPD